MDPMKDYAKMLELLPQPAFAAAEGTVIYCNRQAKANLLETGTPVSQLLQTGHEEYKALEEGCLCLRLNIRGTFWDATVTRLEGVDLFRMEQADMPAEVKAMALMGSQLRMPVSNLSILTDRYLSGEDQAAAFRQELSRIQRLLNNASNTERYLTIPQPELMEQDACAILRELMEEAGTLLEQAGLKLVVQLPDHPVFTAVDEHGLRQAVYNLLNNAAKFSPPGSTISCRVTVSPKQLRISVSDQGDGIPAGQHAGIFTRFARQPAFEDGRHNLGLGLALVRAVAAAHSGAVLVDTPENSGTRVTMTIALQKQTVPTLRASNKLKTVPSADEGLIMLSDVLPQSLYQK